MPVINKPVAPVTAVKNSHQPPLYLPHNAVSSLANPLQFHFTCPQYSAARQFRVCVRVCVCGSPRLQEWMEIRILISHSQLWHPSKTGRLTREKQGSWARLSEACTLNWRCARHPLVGWMAENQRGRRKSFCRFFVIVAVVLFLD